LAGYRLEVLETVANPARVYAGQAGELFAVRGCDFFEFARKLALKTKALRALKRLVLQKSHSL
jgi:hypothetical protein